MHKYRFTVVHKHIYLCDLLEATSIAIQAKF